MFKHFIILLLLTFTIFSTNSFSAEAENKTENKAEEKPEQEFDEDGKVIKKEPLRYFKINPNIITTYQNTGKKMKYIVVQVQIVVRGENDYDMVGNHMPLLQDALTDFFNRQDKDVIEDLSKRETLRTQALERVDAVLLEEIGEDIIESVVFTQYVYQ